MAGHMKKRGDRTKRAAETERRNRRGSEHEGEIQGELDLHRALNLTR